jgi:hypothetical protein
LKVLFLGWFFISSIPFWYRQYKDERYPSRPALYGLYDVEQFNQNGTDHPSLLTDGVRWKRVVIDYLPRTAMAVQMMDDSIRNYNVEYDETGNTVAFYLGRDKKKYVLNCSRPDADHLEMEGVLGDDSVVIRLKRIDASKFPLISRGFHWMSETQNSLIR